jgi:hypothetical protein
MVTASGVAVITTPMTTAPMAAAVAAATAMTASAATFGQGHRAEDRERHRRDPKHSKRSPRHHFPLRHGRAPWRGMHLA